MMTRDNAAGIRQTLGIMLQQVTGQKFNRIGWTFLDHFGHAYTYI